jgi:hypothetical protein
MTPEYTASRNPPPGAEWDPRVQGEPGTGVQTNNQRRERGDIQKVWRLEVEWSDSQVIGGSWEPIRALLKRRKSVHCHSVGFVLADDERGVVLAASVNGANATGVTIIPVSQIVKRRRLR